MRHKPLKAARPPVRKSMPAIDATIRKLVELGGSDLHLSCGQKPAIRLDGTITPLEVPVLTQKETEDLLCEIMPARNREEFDSTNDTDFSYEIPAYVRLRVNVFRDRVGVGAVIRAIPSTIISSEQLDLPKAVTDFCDLSRGLVVVTGPTGSGKSTTLSAMVDLVNRTRADHIITVEDPVEFVHENKKSIVTQREVHSHTQSFARALRAALREDPDIIMVGELRDLETTEIAIETAETGHLVFGTLHTNSAASTVDRLIDCFPSERQSQIRSMLASSLKGVVAQTLCRRRKGGRVAALEILIVERGVSCLIREGKTHQIPSAMQVGRGLGMQLLNDSLAGLVRQGIVDPREAYRKSVDKEDLLSRYQKFGIDLAASGEAEDGEATPAVTLLA